jgi:hypothetical protein
LEAAVEEAKQCLDAIEYMSAQALLEKLKAEVEIMNKLAAAVEAKDAEAIAECITKTKEINLNDDRREKIKGAKEALTSCYQVPVKAAMTNLCLLPFSLHCDDKPLSISILIALSHLHSFHTMSGQDQGCGRGR